MPTSRRGRSTGVPPMTIAPVVGGSRPATIISKVLLPQPDGPRIETNSPAAAAKVTELTASTGPVAVPKILRTALAVISASAAAAPARVMRWSVAPPYSPFPRRGVLGAFGIGLVRRGPLEHPFVDMTGRVLQLARGVVRPRRRMQDRFIRV